MVIQDLVVRYSTGRVSREVIQTAYRKGMKAEAHGNMVSLGLSWRDSED